MAAGSVNKGGILLANRTSGDVGKPAPRRGKWNIKYAPVTAAQTFKVGDWVGKDSNGTLIIAAAASANYDSSTPALLWGIALANAADILANPSGSDLALCPVAVPTRDAEFLTQIYHATAASAVLADTALDAPTTLPLRNQSGAWQLALADDGTNDAILVTERYRDSSGTDQYPWVWGKLLSGESLEGD